MTITFTIGTPPFPIPSDFRTSTYFLGSLADQSAEAAKTNPNKDKNDEPPTQPKANGL